jgi:hypothetical protein
VKRSFTAVAVVSACAVACWVLWPGQTRPTLNGPSDAEGEPTRTEENTPSSPVGLSTTREVSFARTLQVNVLRDGVPEPAAQVCAWTADRRAFLSEAVVERVGVPASVEPVGAGVWTVGSSDSGTCMYVQASAGPDLRRAIVVEPTDDRDSLTIDLTRWSAAIDVRVLDGDRFAAGLDHSVLLERRSPDGSVERLQETSTGDSGRCSFAVDAPGAYVVRVADDGPERSVTIGAEGPLGVTICLVTPPQLHTTSFVIDADAPGRRAVGLYARRISSGPAVEQPIAWRIANGVHSRQADLPAGAYEVVALPSDGLVVESSRVFDVPTDAPIQLSVRRPSASEQTRVRLEGVSVRHFPLRVFARSDDGVMTHRLDVPIMGPRRWSAHPQVVGPIESPARIVAVGRSACFLSKDPVSTSDARLTDGDLVVPMVAASELHVQWSGSDAPHADARVVLSIETDGGQGYVKAMRPTTVGLEGDSDGLAWEADLVVPKGRVVVECVGPGGVVRARAAAEARGRRTVVRLGPGRP